MQESVPLNSLAIQFLFFLPFWLSIAVIAHLLAKEKERTVWLWTVLGAVPILNFVCLWFFVGAANLRLERKIDEVLKHRAG
jgi:hypothetical protein